MSKRKQKKEEPKTLDERIDEDNILIKQLDFLQAFDFGGKRFEHPLLDLLDKSDLDFKSFKQVSVDPNLLILRARMGIVEQFEPEWKYKNAYINMERLNCVLFQVNPWYRSRKGHEMWWYANYVNPDSYYILSWENHYDPRIWNKPGLTREQCVQAHTEG